MIINLPHQRAPFYFSRARRRSFQNCQNQLEQGDSRNAQHRSVYVVVWSCSCVLSSAECFCFLDMWVWVSMCLFACLLVCLCFTFSLKNWHLKHRNSLPSRLFLCVYVFLFSRRRCLASVSLHEQLAVSFRFFCLVLFLFWFVPLCFNRFNKHLILRFL